jgi:hypothetical protein
MIRRLLPIDILDFFISSIYESHAMDSSCLAYGKEASEILG